ncbi:hypothetical protein [Rhizobium sp. LC145]|uniref:hypothetical protein n=1 Tax=Rhizobium sp. LC145 TaxID=1120688 RepID=UPI00062A2B49|nr:hypothetical protein [Rhizobium sp. LC145]KKX24327.1 hypothetical protein YH62_27640 [Rhizobium sp. LC145]TKT46141.1 hypothetical protein FDR95_23555 [Rhizobiaceae bacterium LC148]
MTTNNREAELRQLTRLKRVRDGIEGYAWEIEVDRNSTHLVAVRRGREAERIITIHPAASPDEIDLFCSAADSLRFLLTLIERATARIIAMQGSSAPREQKPNGAPPPARKGKNSAALSAKSLCEQVMFRRFLETKGPGGMLGDERAADTRLKFLLNIQSKRQLNEPGPAREAFYAMRAEYYLWKKGDL